jgi:hypothetical protein
MTHRYKGKKCKTPLKANREMCIECMGGRDSEGYQHRIKDCASIDCPLFSFRFGKDPYRCPNLSADQRKRMADRMEKINSARQIVAKKPSDLGDFS